MTRLIVTLGEEGEPAAGWIAGLLKNTAGIEDVEIEAEPPEGGEDE